MDKHNIRGHPKKECEYRILVTEHPTSNSVRYVERCKVTNAVCTAIGECSVRRIYGDNYKGKKG